MAEEKTMDKVKIFRTTFWIILAVIIIAILIIVLLHLLGPEEVTDSPEAVIRSYESIFCLQYNAGFRNHNS